MYKTLAVAICVILCVFVYLWQQTTAVRFGYKVSELQAEYDRLNAENDGLRLKINSILALEKMDKIAKDKKLFKPDEKSVINIE